ncbi:hypothetical protein [Arcobacter aquimarinus]|uniref:Uncharacterized protein n=1 Tax=Arcobacter aquimarinus TaxID=1315211 RepID=A0AAE7B3I1_9BACT|nr:hypothetical protein [Arcobacter aquimarinus]MCB9096380.1 hypothetical protein [Arcobacter sp.]QKE25172.1 hypothetical protein AAQM_0399 [Arcobacter aquimarinus]RXI36380.1 hypothetical protein CP986_02110 [Arcobacter aquimarinus]
MKKFILTLFLIISNLFSFDSNIQGSYAIGIFHENGTGENIQHKKITQDDYNGICFSKIVIFGNISNNSKIEVKIGNSLGYIQNQIPIYNKNKIKIGTEITFIHYNVDKGYFEIKIDNKLYDSKVFIK